MTFDKLTDPTDEGPDWWKRAAWVGAGIVVLAGLGGLWWWQAQASAGAERRERSEELARLAAEAEELRSATAADDKAEMRRIEALLRTERALAEIEPGGLQRRLSEIQRLEGELDRLLAASKLALSHERETDWPVLDAAGDRAGAERALREAWELQREVNRVAPEAMRSREREQRLEREFIRYAAEPLKARVDAAAAQATEALNARRWSEALALLREARDGQDRLNRGFARTKYSDVVLLARLDAELLTLETGGLDAQVAAALAAGREHAQAGRETAAAESFAAAVQAQRELNERYPRSRFVSMERLEEIEVERHTLLAAAAWRGAAELDHRMAGHLRRRQVFQARQALDEAVRLLADGAGKWPKARGTDEELRLRLNYLNGRASTLAALQDRIYDQLRPLPGRPQVALLRATVRQEDFTAVMNRNPSRQAGAERPVDSVGAVEALEFCVRLSWLMGCPVRLPRDEELRGALADAAGEFSADPDGSGEWLEGTDAAGMQAWWNRREGRVAYAPPGNRSRDRGFRFVVEIDLAAPDKP